MLRAVEVQCRLGISYPETEFYCPYCNTWMRFYSISAKSCAICDRVLPDVAKMKGTRQCRVEYHWGLHP